MTGSLKELRYYIGGFLLLLVTLFVLIRFTGYYIPFSFALVVSCCGILFYVAGIHKAFHLVLLSLPLAMSVAVTAGSQLMFPSELLVASLGIAIVIYWILHPARFYEMIKQPVSVVLAGYLFFLFVSVFFSEMLMVSVKSAIVKSLYIISFYGGGFIYFRKVKPDGKFIGYYLLPLLLVICMVIIRHSGFEFSKDVSGFVTKPFYNDHTIYSAALAFILPLALMRTSKATGFGKYYFAFSAVLIAVAIFIASSRAAWLSVAVAVLFGTLIFFRFPPIGYLIIAVITTAIVFFNFDEVVWQLKSNRSDSNARNAGIEEQTRSLTNITNDQSNAERINRWKCAVRMFMEKPLTGFGPGTYQFVYFPFQRESDMTRISVKSPYNIAEGRGGTAHNEFLLVLSESGILAALFFMLCVLMTIRKGILFCNQQEINPLDTAMLLAFITFITHSMFNNFLDTDKTAILFYSAIAYFAAPRTIEKNMSA